MLATLRRNSQIPRLALGLIGLGLIAASLFVGCRRNDLGIGQSAAPSVTVSGSGPAGQNEPCPHHEAGGGCGMGGSSGCSHMRGTEGAAPTTQVPIPAKPSGTTSLVWSLPDGWSEESGTGLRIATLRPAKHPSVEITIIALEGPAGGELANVNRWREQLGLPSVNTTALESTRNKVASKAGEIIVHDLLGPNGNGIVAGMVSPPGGHTWFLKMSGDSKSLSAVRDTFYLWIRGLRQSTSPSGRPT